MTTNEARLLQPTVLLFFSNPNPQLLPTSPKRLSVFEFTARMSVTIVVNGINKQLEGYISRVRAREL